MHASVSHCLVRVLLKLQQVLICYCDIHNGLLICTTVLDIGECASNPCVNDATCVDNVNEYTCNCAAGYTGTHCEQGVKILK